MSDLGDAVSLDTWLLSGPDTEVAASVGRNFGEFLGRLNSVFEFVKQGKKLEEAEHPNLYEHFENQSAHDNTFDTAIAKLESNLLECTPGFDPAEARHIGELCISMYERQQARIARRETNVFSIGDSWPMAYLIGGAGLDLKLSAIDWEFAGMIGPLIDLSQLCAHLYLLCRTLPAKFKEGVKTYTLALIRAHQDSTPEWQYKNEYRVDGWIVFGREIINNALERDWWDGDEVKKQAEREMLGEQGAAFVKEAERRSKEEGPLFGSVFDAL
ncbi:hypothetical protein RSAG8_09940, partial [Rhizoctonia solani AG-8 WAC10335]